MTFSRGGSPSSKIQQTEISCPHSLAPLWTLNELIDGVSGRLVHKDLADRWDQEKEPEEPAEAVYGVSIDSRTISPGEVYFAIKGKLHDGHSFVDQAFQHGAVISVIEEGRLDEMSSGRRYITVPDVDDALRSLGRAARQRSQGVIIAVTGSVGKTSTKEILHRILTPYGKVQVSSKSFNNHWGVPLTLSRLSPDSDYCVLEIGSDHPGEIAQLVSLVQPHIAIVTAIAPAHIGNFSGITDIAKEKACLFEAFPDQTDDTGKTPSQTNIPGTAIINADTAEAEMLINTAKAKKARVFTFGESKSSTMRLVSTSSKGVCGTGVSAIISDSNEALSYCIGAPGKHLVMNSLAALTTLRSLGLDLTRATEQLAHLRAIEGRGQLTDLYLNKKDPSSPTRALLIDESYNANPASMHAALNLLNEIGEAEYRRRIAVLGDMADLGDQSPELHAKLNEVVRQSGLDKVFLVGPLMENLWKLLPLELRGGYAHSPEMIGPILLSCIQAGDVIMIKGANYMRMHVLVENLKTQFSTR